MSKILCKLTDESSKFSTLLFYLHKNFYTLEFINIDIKVFSSVEKIQKLNQEKHLINT